MQRTTTSTRRAESDRWMIVIAAFKLVKGVLLVAAGIGALKLLHKDVAQVVQHWIDVLRVDPGNHYVHATMLKLLSVNDRRLEEISAGTFAYAAVFLTEGTGLFLRKRWAEYFTVIVTTSFLPLEFFELAGRASLAKMMVIVLNIAIVVYFIIRLRTNREH